MNYSQALEKLERLRGIVEQLSKDLHSPSEESRQLWNAVCELYGEVEEVYQQFAGRREVKVQGVEGMKTFSTYLEAGYLSGRTALSYEGYTELLKVIGRVRQKVADPVIPRDERSVATVIEILQRFRPCCQYLKAAPGDERAVQEIIWIMLRSRFDRLDRENMLPRFGVKKYAPDFGIPELGLLVEAKYIGEATRPGDIQEEILADVPGYLQDQSIYDAIVVLVYDAAHKIRDDRKFIEDLRSVEGIIDVILIPGIGGSHPVG
jgi:REase_DpnII-MboI